MRANCYWGLFTGPDIESFFKPYGVLRQEKYFILVEQLGTMLASSDMWDPAAKARGAHMLDQFKDTWTAYSIAYRAVKHTGHQHQERLKFIQEVLPRFCRLYKQVVVAGDREPPPKWHMKCEHTISFIKEHQFSYRAAEEALESTHGRIKKHLARYANQPSFDKKMTGN